MFKLIIDKEKNEYKVIDLKRNIYYPMETETLARELHQSVMNGEPIKKAVNRIEYREYGVCWGSPE